MGILDGKRILVTGVLTDASIASTWRGSRRRKARRWCSRRTAGRRSSKRIAKRLPEPPPVIELDVTNATQLASLPDRVREHVDGLDGVVHSIAFAPQAALGGNFLDTRGTTSPPPCTCPRSR